MRWRERKRDRRDRERESFTRGKTDLRNGWNMFRLERCFGLIDKVKPQIFQTISKPFCYNDGVLFSKLKENNIVSAHCVTNTLALLCYSCKHIQVSVATMF